MRNLKNGRLVLEVLRTRAEEPWLENVLGAERLASLQGTGCRRYFPVVNAK